jgi:hypothetical protein
MVSMADIPKTLKKLREARFFLGWMKNAAKLMDFEREDFDFYLSAFLSAGRSVTLVLQVEQKDLYDAQYGPWESNLPGEDQALMKFMNRQRRKEVHLLGADIEAAIEMVPITQIETQPGTDPRYSYSISWWGETGIPPEIGRKVRYFESGQQVVAECTRYFKLLEKVVRQFDPDFEYRVY